MTIKDVFEMKRIASLFLVSILIITLVGCVSDVPPVEESVSSVDVVSDVDTVSDSVVIPDFTFTDDEIDPKEWGNTPGNLANGGRVAMWRDWIIFSTNEETYIVDENGGKPIRILGSDLWYINVVGDWVYGIEAISYKGRLVKMRPDGSDFRILCDEIGFIPYINLYVIGGWMYHTKFEGFYPQICRMKTDGSNLEVLVYVRESYEFDYGIIVSMDDSWIYYSCEYAGDPPRDNHYYTVYRMRHDGSEQMKIFDKCGAPFIANNGKLYYTDNDVSRGEFASILEGSKRFSTPIKSPEYIFSMNACDDKIYFTAKDVSNGVINFYFIGSDGKGIAKLFDYDCGIDENIYGDLYIFANKLYYFKTDTELWCFDESNNSNTLIVKVN